MDRPGAGWKPPKLEQNDGTANRYKPSFISMLESFRATYRADFEARVLDNMTLSIKRIDNIAERFGSEVEIVHEMYVT